MDNCFMCGGAADTSDHVPPKGLFPKPRPSTLITVPACRVCNKATEQDDEYFRFLMSAAGNDTRAAAALRQQRIIPQLQERPALGHAIMEKSKIVDVYSPGGIWLERRPAFEFEHTRFQRVIEKTVRGLYLHEFGERLIGAKIDDFVLNPEPSDELRTYFARLSRRVVDADVFSYWCDRDPADLISSLWFLGFFKQTLFVVRTMGE